MLIITQGDTALLTLIATDGFNNPIDITGATFTTYVRGIDGTPISFPNSQHTGNPDQVNFRGYFTLALSSINTNSIPTSQPNVPKEVITDIVIGSTTINYRGQILIVLSPTPNP